MSSVFSTITNSLWSEPKTWLITGVAGFIGSNLLETLLKLNQTVIGLDNYSTGFKDNLIEVKEKVTKQEWNNFIFYEGDIIDRLQCEKAVKNVDYVLHQAALGSVPRSIQNPIKTNEVNVSGFLNILDAAKDEKVQSFTYAASSSTYGDHPALPKIEGKIGNPLSPYAVTKYINELYADVYSRVYGFDCIGLRYFNVFGKRQNPDGDYAAVIPRWTAAMLAGADTFINGDGTTSRDFCFVDNVVQINILAATSPKSARNEIYNVAVGNRTSLSQLHAAIQLELSKHGVSNLKPAMHREFRPGDVMHSQANISKAKKKLGYNPTYDLRDGLGVSMEWYIEKLLTEDFK